MIEFVIPGKAVGKGRPRFRKVGAFVQTYTPEKTVSWENLVAVSAMNARGDLMPTDSPVSLRVEVQCLPPASWSKKKQLAALAGEVHPAKKPDLDNVIKAIGDALNGVLWVDDCQIVRVEAWKRYASADQCRVRVEAV